SNVATSIFDANSASAFSSRQSPTIMGANCPAQASATVSITRKRKPSGAPASASMRASWPPPRIPTVVIAGSLAGVVVLRDVVGLALAESLEGLRDRRLVRCKHRGSEQGRVRCTRIADREGRHGNARRHLHDRQQGIHAVER